MDVVFLLKTGEQLEDMKTFVKAFINSVDIGVYLTISIGLVEVLGRDELFQGKRTCSSNLELIELTMTLLAPPH